MAKSPVFNSAHGFGGDSHPDRSPSTEMIVGEDRCVDSGPFSGLEVHWFGKQDFPHCLSRGFHYGSEMDEVAYLIRPEAIEKLLHLPSYDEFFLGLEEGPHNAIPAAIGGDFSFTVAPYGEMSPAHVQLHSLMLGSEH
jgi:tyrosinase